MRKIVTSMLLAAATGVFAFPSFALAQKKAEGKVISTKLTACDMNPGGCEGTMTLETTTGSKPEQLSIRVIRGTPITKAGEHVYLPALRGNFVTVSYVLDKGEKLAKSIEVLQTKR